MRTQLVGQQSTRLHNQACILAMLRDQKSVTRAAIAQRLCLSPPSVSNNVERLLAGGLVISRGPDDAADGPGRKGTLLELNPRFAYVAAVDLSGSRLRVALCDLCERPLCFQQSVCIEGKNGRYILDCVISTLDRLLEQQGLPAGALGAISVCAPGVIDGKTGRMHFGPQFDDWDSLNLKQSLGEQFHTEVIVKNDANVIALGEAKYGYGVEYPSFVLLHIDLGVGAGIVLGGDLYEGANCAAGELAYMMTSAPDLYPFAPHETLEQCIAIPRWLDHLAHVLGEPRQDVSIARVNALYAEGHPVVLREIEALTRHLAMAVVNLNTVLDVPLVCLSGAVTRLQVDLLTRTQAQLAGMSPCVPRLSFSHLGEEGAFRGTFWLGVEQIFSKYLRNYYGVPADQGR